MNNTKITVTIATIMIFIGIFLLSYNFINEKREYANSTNNLSLSNEVNETKFIEEKEITTQKEEETIEDNTIDSNYEYYIGTININKIDLVKGFYDKDSKLNDLRWNIKVLKESSYPDIESGNLIIAGHSGNYSNSYFKDLYKLELGDIAIVEYNDIEYTYKITNIYTDDKDGNVEIRRNTNKSCLTLITCTKDSDNLQTIYIFELIKKKRI